MKNAYKLAKTRTENLAKASLKNYDFNTSLRLIHKEGSEFIWRGCYFEFKTYESIKFIIIAPEHHPAVFYDLSDVDCIINLDNMKCLYNNPQCVLTDRY